jgi:hypothetical protein
MKSPFSLFSKEKNFLGLTAAWAFFVLFCYFRKVPDPVGLILSAFEFDSPVRWEFSMAVKIWSESFGLVIISLLLVLSIWRVGKFLGRGLGLVKQNVLLGIPMEFGLGMVGVVQLWMALGFLDLWYRPFLVGLLAVLVLWALWDLWKDQAGVTLRLRGHIPLPKTFLTRVLAVLGISQVLFSFGHGLVPETWVDSLVYHLGFLTHWLGRHGIADMPTNSIITYPFGGELYFFNGIIIGSTEISKLLNVWIFLFLILFSGGWALEMGGVEAAWLAMAMVATLPMLIINVWTTQVEGLLAFYTMLSLYCVVRFWKSEQGSVSRWIVPSSIYGGMILSIKYTGFIFFIAVCLGFLWQSIVSGRWKFQNPMLMTKGAFLSLLVFGPWSIRNICWTGNPVYPYLNQWIGFRHLSEYHTSQLMWFSRSYPGGLGEWCKIPWNLTMPPVSQFNFLGPTLLAVIPVLVWARPIREDLRILIKISVVYCLISFFIIQIPRFHIPLFVLFSLVLACVWEPLQKGMGGKWLALFVLISALLTFPFLSGISSHYLSCGGIWTGRENRDDYLKRMIPEGNYEWTSWIKANTESNARVLITTDPRGYYMGRSFYSNMVCDPYPFHELVRHCGDENGMAKKLKEMGVDYVVAQAQGPIENESWLPEEEKLTLKEWGILRDFIQKRMEPVFSTNDKVVYKVLEKSKP